MRNLQNKGFTLLELLVVVAIIGMLSAVVMSSVKTSRVKARDAVRAKDMQTIHVMLHQYNLQFGGIPRTNQYGGVDAGSWDYSSQPTGSPSFLSFLVTSGIAPKVPIDPINNMIGDSASGYGYKYYCYPGEGLALGYRKEANGPTSSVIYYPIFKESGWSCL